MFFLAILFGTKGYKLLEVAIGRVFISRNVKFYEQIIPFSDTVGINRFLDKLFIEQSSKDISDIETSDIIVPLNNNNTNTAQQDLVDDYAGDTFAEPTSSSTQTSAVEDNTQQRRSTRVRHIPAYLQVYETSLPSIKTFDPSNTSNDNIVQHDVNFVHANNCKTLFLTICLLIDFLPLINISLLLFLKYKRLKPINKLANILIKLKLCSLN